MAHTVIKPEQIAPAAVGLLEKELVLPNLFRKEGVDRFKGVKNDTISFRVPGVLPGRDYTFRNDRSSAIVFDEYTETKVDITFGGHAYSGVRLTDEQLEFDFGSWSTLLSAQARGVGTKLQYACRDAVESQTYNVVIGGLETDARASLVEARRVLRAFGAPGPYTMVVGTNVEALFLLDENLSKTTNVSEDRAEAALANATIGRLYGFNIVVDQTINPNNAYALAPDAFVLATAAPTPPRSAPFTGTAAFEGLALRWIRDYDPEYFRDRSIVDCWYGIRAVKDNIRYWDTSLTPDAENVMTTEAFVRGVKLTIGGSDSYPTNVSALGVATGIYA